MIHYGERRGGICLSADSHHPLPVLYITPYIDICSVVQWSIKKCELSSDVKGQQKDRVCAFSTSVLATDYTESWR